MLLNAPPAGSLTTNGRLPFWSNRGELWPTGTCRSTPSGRSIVAERSAERRLAALLFQTSAADPPTFSVVPLLLLAVAVLASYLPAQRASRADPMAALRCE